ncbi:ATP-grasp domain-containing protein [Streptomyces sp. NPDC050161]|uniref:ATP-grasp domain-containing protein n=1 Tax=Streptomyces sp. NPDC050161 TaxID=3365604 RepID=UPI0037A3BD8D
MPARPVVLVVIADTDPEAYRGYCLEQVAAVYDVVLITGSEPTWQRPHLIDYEVADPGDQAALSAAGRALAARHLLAGVMTWTEWYLVPVARLARQLGLPTTAPEAMQGCRNKAASRTLFARHGVPSAASASAATVAEAAAAAERIGYPVVLKPASHAASIGVIRVDHRAALDDAFAFASRAAERSTENPRVLVEGYLDGPEVSVECVSYRGVTAAVAVTRKTLSPPPLFEEVAHSVDAADPLLTTVAPAATAAVQALGITDGVSHVEVRLVDGRPRLIEVNGRIAGDMIGHLVHLATGIDLPRAAADIACGRAPNLAPTRTSAAAIRLLYPDTSGTVAELHLDDAWPWLERTVFQRRPGEKVLLSQDGGDAFTARLGYLITTGPTGTLAQARAQAAQQHLVTDIVPN